MTARWHEHAIRVRYQETDQMGVVYHTNYLNWFEWGRTEWVRAYGISYQQLEENGLLLPVIEAGMKLHAPALYDQQVLIRTKLAVLQPMLIRFQSEVRAVDEASSLIASGWTDHVWMNRQRRIVRLDRQMPEFYRILLHTMKEHPVEDE